MCRSPGRHAGAPRPGDLNADRWPSPEPGHAAHPGVIRTQRPHRQALFGLMEPAASSSGITPRLVPDFRHILAVLANVPTAMGGEGPVIGCGIAYARKPRKGKVRVTAPDPGRCTSENLRVHSRARIFRARKRCRQDATDGETVRTQEEGSPPAAICPSMTDYRVRHLVTG